MTIKQNIKKRKHQIKKVIVPEEEVKPQDTLQISMNNRSMSMNKLGMVNDSFLNFEVANLSQISEAEHKEAAETLSSEEDDTPVPRFDLFVQL